MRILGPVVPPWVPLSVFWKIIKKNLIPPLLVQTSQTWLSHEMPSLKIETEQNNPDQQSLNPDREKGNKDPAIFNQEESRIFLRYSVLITQLAINVWRRCGPQSAVSLGHIQPWIMVQTKGESTLYGIDGKFVCGTCGPHDNCKTSLAPSSWFLDHRQRTLHLL